MTNFKHNLIKGSVIGLLSLAVLALPGCSSDEEVLYPIDNANGVYEDGAVTLTYNGAEVPNSKVEVLVNNFNPEEPYEGDIYIQFLSISTMVMNYDMNFDQNNRSYAFIPGTLAIKAKAKSEDGVIAFVCDEEQNASYNNDGKRLIKAIGRIIPNATGKPGKLEADVSITYEGGPLVGKTFEMSFNRESIYPEITHGYIIHDPTFNMEITDLCEEFYNRIMDNYSEKSEIDAVKMTFEPDGTLKLAYHDKTSGQYVDSPSSKYILNKDGYMFIFSNSELINEILKNFKPEGVSFMHHGSLPVGVYFYGFGQDIVLGARWRMDKEGKLIIQPVSPVAYLDISKLFLQTWAWGPLTENMKMLTTVHKYVKDNKLWFKPSFAASPVNSLK